jgi:two-component system, NtrC family, response regulator HydG
MRVSRDVSSPFAALADFSDQLASITVLDELLEGSVQFISNYCVPTFVSIAVFKSSNFELVAEQRKGFHSERKSTPSIELSGDVADGMTRGGEVLALTNHGSNKFLVYFDKEQHFLCELRLPFFYNAECIGVLSLGKKESGTDYSLDEIDVLRIAVNYIALKCGQVKHADESTITSQSETNEKKELTIASQQLKPKIKVRSWDDETGLLGECPEMLYVKELIDKVARESVSILITGESGTGKELIARAIHKNSKRADNPLVAMNCAALADNLVESELFGHEKGAFTGAYSQKKGKFEFANDSTIFLDEIGDMSLQTQAKLLRVLQDGTFQRVGGNKTLHSNARLLAATNKNLMDQIENKSFREDLYYRINVVQIELPPLRQRGKDIILLAEHFFNYYNTYYHKNLQGITADVYDWLMNFKFSGNIRELRNILERAVIMEHGDKISLSNMPAHLDNPVETLQKPQSKVSLEELEKQHIQSVLEQVNNNKSAAARMLGIARKTLREKIQKYNLPIL